MNDKVIYIFFIIVVFFVIINNFKNLKKSLFSIQNNFKESFNETNKEILNFFRLKSLVGPEIINMNCSSIELGSETGISICLEKSLIIDPTPTLYLDWYIKYKTEDLKTLNKDNEVDFYIIYHFQDDDVKSIKHDKYDPFLLTDQNIFYNTIIDLNTNNDVKNKIYSEDLHIYILGKSNDENYYISNPIIINRLEQNIKKEDSNITYTYVSCNPDGTVDKGLSKSQKAYPKVLNDIEMKQLIKDTDKLLLTLEEKPNKIDIDVNKNIFH